MTKFYSPDLSDRRLIYTADYLEKMGYEQVNSIENADFLLLGINYDKKYLNYNLPIPDYKNDELFQLDNAYLTAQSALVLAVEESEKSLISSSVLIVGYGRIGKALHKCLSPFTNDITVCARNKLDRQKAIINNAKAVDFDYLKNKNTYDFIFNTVPHPVINEKELNAVKNDVLIIDLASFPGGVDNHIAKSKGINLVIARGLPAKYSPQSSGKIVATAVDRIVKEGR
jgi:dipicolinate synthase subunit A